jgi:ATP-dependent Clp protease protease subunit
MGKKSKGQGAEFALVGDIDDWESDLIKDLLDLKPGGACSFYIDSAGGSVYGAMAILTLMHLRKLKVTSYVLGECSSATLLLFAASQKRYVTPYSTLFFHRMRWESDKRVDSVEARHWAAHFQKLEDELQVLEARLFGEVSRQQVKEWINEARFLTGRQVAAAGLAELVEM